MAPQLAALPPRRSGCALALHGLSLAVVLTLAVALAFGVVLFVAAVVVGVRLGREFLLYEAEIRNHLPNDILKRELVVQAVA